MSLKMKLLIRGIKAKIANGEQLSDILNSYVNLTDEEKQVIAEEIVGEVI